jgi:hypothetical protein
MDVAFDKGIGGHPQNDVQYLLFSATCFAQESSAQACCHVLARQGLSI